MSSPPCQDCLIFPMCKSKFDTNPTYTGLMRNLYPHCSLIVDHLSSEDWETFEYSPTKISHLVHFFLTGEYHENTM